MSLRVKFVSDDRGCFERFEKIFQLTQQTEKDFAEVELKHFTSTATAIADNKENTTDCFVFYASENNDGIAHIRRIRLHKDFLFAPVIVISNKKHKVSLPDYIRHGVQDFFVEKDLTPVTLTKALKNVLGKVRIWGNIRNQKRKKEDHLAVVSHDIKGPLSIIKSYMDILLTDPSYDLNERATEKIKRSRHNANLALNLVIDILDEFRSKKNMRLNFEKLSCIDILTDVIKNLKYVAQDKGTKLTINSESDYFIFADKKSMYQLFTNLLDNAIKYSPANSTVKITMHMNSSAISEKKRVTVIISDEGPGLDPSKLESIFSPFKQASDDDFIKGHGLGLSICRRICQYHMGKIWASNRMNRGTAFNVLLPIFNKAEIQGKLASEDKLFDFSESKYKINDNKYILIVDDSKDVRDITKKALVDLGFRVSTAKNGLEALEVIEQSTPDLILLDLNMPVLTGDQFLQVLQGREIKLPVLLFSMLKSESIFISSLNKANGFIQKPLMIKEFITKTSVYFSWEYTKISNGKYNGSAQPQVSPQLLKQKKEKKLKVLIVDDCKDNHVILKYYFYKNKHSFDSAFSGQECLDKISQSNFDIVILDLNMPGMDGFQTAKKIKTLNAELPLLAFSADDTKYNIHDSSKELFKGFLLKPISPDLLNKMVNRYTLC